MCAGQWHFQEAHCSKNISRSTEIEVCVGGREAVLPQLVDCNTKKITHAEMEKHRRSTSVCLVQLLLVSQYTGGPIAVMLFFFCIASMHIIYCEEHNLHGQSMPVL